MDRIDELNKSVGKLNLLTDTKIVCTLVFDEIVARKYFVKTERSLLIWDVDDSNNTMGAFLRLD
jgi:hypothetical protein